MAEDAENCSNSAMGGTWVRGGGGNRRSWPPLSHLLKAGVRGEGEGREKREQIRPCTKCSLHACSFTLCLSFSYLRSAVATSFDIKKIHGNATRVVLGLRGMKKIFKIGQKIFPFLNHI